MLGVVRGDTIGTVLQRHRGVGPGFDILRIALTAAIFIGHAKWLAGGESLGHMFPIPGVADQVAPAGSAPSPTEWVGFTKGIKLSLVPAFFALSGFLVTGSALRLQRTSTFLAHRALRIFPALAVEVTLSALVLGPILTTIPLASYFSDPALLRYFGNIVGEVSFSLPGLFAKNSVSAVNLNLWTLPSEMHCYLIAAGLMITGVAYNRALVTIGTALALIALAGAHFLYHISDGAPLPSHLIVLFFFVGTAFYHWKDKIPVSFGLLVACSVASYLFMSSSDTVYLAVLPLTYCIIAVGMLNLGVFKLLKSGDYSYGIYLYGFPLTQALLAVFPQLFGHPAVTVVIAFVLSGLFAAASWHLVEKHVLRLRHRLPEAWFPNTPAERASYQSISTAFFKLKGAWREFRGDPPCEHVAGRLDVPSHCDVCGWPRPR